MLTAGALLLALAILFWFFPAALAYPLIFVFTWGALALLYIGLDLHRHRLSESSLEDQTASRRSRTSTRRTLREKFGSGYSRRGESSTMATVRPAALFFDVGGVLLTNALGPIGTPESRC